MSELREQTGFCCEAPQNRQGIAHEPEVEIDAVAELSQAKSHDPLIPAPLCPHHFDEIAPAAGADYQEWNGDVA